MFDHRPGDTQTVKGTGTTTNFIQDQQTVFRSIPENIGHLGHFHHKGTLTTGQIIRSSHTGKDTVHNADLCLLGRYEGTDLCHQHDQRHLTHVGRFTGHIRSRNNRDPVFTVVQLHIVGDKHIVGDHLFHHRMAAAPDIDHAPGINRRAHIIVPAGYQRKGRKYIQPCHGAGRFLNAFYLGSHFVSDLGKKHVFQRIQLILCPEDHILQFFELRRNITLRIGQRLFSGIVIRHHFLKRIGYLQIIAEYFIIFDTQVTDTGFLPLLCLEIRQPVFSFRFGVAVIVHVLIVTVPDNTALLHGQRRIIHDGRCDQLTQILQSIHILIDLLQCTAGTLF